MITLVDYRIWEIMMLRKLTLLKKFKSKDYHDYLYNDFRNGFLQGKKKPKGQTLKYS